LDLQDVGARYYTFVWTAALAMRACPEADVPVVVLDRPDPLDDWFEFLSAYHEAVLGWVGGSVKIDGVAPGEEAQPASESGLTPGPK
jgi:hypothetical protein